MYLELDFREYKQVEENFNFKFLDSLLFVVDFIFVLIGCVDYRFVKINKKL